MAKRITFMYESIKDTATPFLMSDAAAFMESIEDNVRLHSNTHNRYLGSYVGTAMYDSMGLMYLSGDIEYDAIYYGILMAKVDVHFKELIKEMGYDNELEICCAGPMILVRYNKYELIELYQIALSREVDMKEVINGG